MMLSRRAVSVARLSKSRWNIDTAVGGGPSRASFAIPRAEHATVLTASRRSYSDKAAQGGPSQPPDSTPGTGSGSEPKIQRYIPRQHTAPSKVTLLKSATNPAIELEIGDAYPLRIPNFWLRDACPCALCRDPDSGQRIFSSTTISDAPQAVEAYIDWDGSLNVVWSASGGHKSTWTAAEVRSWKYANSPSINYRAPVAPEPWTRESFESVLPLCRISFNEWTTDRLALRRALSVFQKTGLLFVTDVPDSETAVEQLARGIGPLQETFYGNTWDVISKPRAENIAYTSQFLGLHQDLLYWKETPRIQLLHCLSNSCDGGESLFGDGFHTVGTLRREQPYLLEHLLRPTATFHYNKDEHVYGRKLATVVLGKNRYPTRINWSPPFQGLYEMPTLGSSQLQHILEWKYAAREFEAQISDPNNIFEYKLRPGECVVMDNFRILHGRQRFNTSAGERRLKGCYVSNNSYLTKLAQFRL